MTTKKATRELPFLWNNNYYKLFAFFIESSLRLSLSIAWSNSSCSAEFNVGSELQDKNIARNVIIINLFILLF